MSEWKVPSRNTFRLLLAFLCISVGINVWMAERELKRRATRPTPFTERGSTRVELNASMRIAPNTSVFMGDSHIELFPLNAMFPEHEILNYGISGHTIAQVQQLAKTDLGNTPKQLFVLAGINDLFQGGTAEEVASRMEKLLGALHDHYPEVPIHVLSLLPVVDPYLKDAVIESNKRISAICLAQKVDFIDLYSHFAQDGVMPIDLVYDGIHLNAKGYQRLSELIGPYLN
ncbi:MAG: GDSL-type esterase/lipase family protein [Flavobacteriales bacterium]|nr:hypothetical protein [Flavobacteriales bacterium]